MPPLPDPALRHRALAAYRRHGSYRKAGKKLGISGKRCHELAREGLVLEIEDARRHDEERSTR